MSQKTRNQLYTEINSGITDALNQQITPAIVRGILTDMVDSGFNLSDGATASTIFGSPGAINNGTGTTIISSPGSYIPAGTTNSVIIGGSGITLTQSGVILIAGNIINASQSLSDILNNGNTTGGTDIIMSTGDAIKSSDSTAQIFLAPTLAEIYSSNDFIVLASHSSLSVGDGFLATHFTHSTLKVHDNTNAWSDTSSNPNILLVASGSSVNLGSGDTVTIKGKKTEFRDESNANIATFSNTGILINENKVISGEKGSVILIDNSFSTGIFLQSATSPSGVDTFLPRFVVGASDFLGSLWIGGQGSTIRVDGSTTSTTIIASDNIGILDRSSHSIATFSSTGLMMAESKVIKSANGGGQIDMDYFGYPGEVSITTDGGIQAESYLYMYSTDTILNAIGGKITLNSFGMDVNIGSSGIYKINTGSEGHIFDGIYNGSPSKDIIRFGDNYSTNIITSNTDKVCVSIASAYTSIGTGITSSVAIGGSNISITQSNTVYVPNLKVEGTSSALTVSRLTTTQKNALTAVNGMIVYDTTLNKFQGYENGAWTNLI